MKQFIKIIFFLLAIFYANISEAKVVTFYGIVSEVNITVNTVGIKINSTLCPVFKEHHITNPFASINAKQRYATLSNGRFDEIHEAVDSIQYYHALLNTKTKKIIQLLPIDTSDDYKVDPVVFALSVDPMADERSWLSPYNYCQWNPIRLIDPKGLLDDEIKVNVEKGEKTKVSNKGGTKTQYVNYTNNKNENLGTDVINGSSVDIEKNSNGGYNAYESEPLPANYSTTYNSNTGQFNVNLPIPGSGIIEFSPVNIESFLFGARALTSGLFKLVTIPKSLPKPSPKFQTPSNPPTNPPQTLPKGYSVRIMKPTEQYPNGYWVQSREFAPGKFEPINPAAGITCPTLGNSYSFTKKLLEIIKKYFMYKIPIDYSFEKLIKSKLTQICFTQSTITLNFGVNGFINIWGNFSIFIENSFYSYKELYPIMNDFKLFTFLEHEVVDVLIDDKREIVSLIFDNFGDIKLIGNQFYESYQINIDSKEILI